MQNRNSIKYGVTNTCNKFVELIFLYINNYSALLIFKVLCMLRINKLYNI